jgi:hypothetical protein
VRRLAVTWVLVAFATTGGAALAATISGTDRSDRLTGTPRPDRIFGHAGGDVLSGLGGDDLLDGGLGRDTLKGGAGNDRIWTAQDGARDSIACGAGRDLVNAELTDTVAPDCETVVRQLSRDGFSTLAGQHQTEVEPASASFGRTVVAAFQAGRFVDGGAAGIGFSTSTDAGTTWRSGFLPGLTIYSVPAGTNELASDPSVAYDSVHGVWLIATLAGRRDQWGMYVSRSKDGLTWSLPVTAVLADPDGIDKEWVTCDRWASSPFRGRCYLSFLDAEAKRIVTSTSRDGGLTWSTPVAPAGPQPVAAVNGAQPVVRPDGTVVILYSSLYGPSVVDDEIVAVRSGDGGATFSAETRVAEVALEDVYELRSPTLPSAGIDGAGRLYTAWQDCRFTDQCDTVDLVLSTSRDGVSWSTPVRIPTTPAGSGVNSLVAGLGVDSTSRGSTARLAVVYYTLPRDCTFQVTCPGIDARMTSSTNGGLTWGTPERLSAEAMRFTWIADGGVGRMVGDYMALSYVRGRPIPVFSIASEPGVDGTFRQAVFARVR